MIASRHSAFRHLHRANHARYTWIVPSQTAVPPGSWIMTSSCLSAALRFFSSLDVSASASVSTPASFHTDFCVRGAPTRPDRAACKVCVLAAAARSPYRALPRIRPFASLCNAARPCHPLTRRRAHLTSTLSLVPSGSMDAVGSIYVPRDSRRSSASCSTLLALHIGSRRDVKWTWS